MRPSKARILCKVDQTAKDHNSGSEPLHTHCGIEVNQPIKSQENSVLQLALQCLIEAKNKPVLGVLQTVSDCVLESVPSVMEGPVNIQSDEMSLTVQRIEPTVDAFHVTADPEDDDNPGGSIFFPNDMKSGTKKPFEMQMMIIKKNPFQWSPTTDDVNLPVMKISVKNDGKSLNPSDLPVPADIFISVNLSNVMEEDKIYTLNVTYNTINHKVKDSSTVRIAIPAIIKAKTQILKLFAINPLLKLEVVLGANESGTSFRNFQLNGFDWPMEDGALLTYKNQKQDPNLLFLPEDILGKNDTNFYVFVRVKNKGQTQRKNASAIVRGSENASAIVRRSENASAIVRRSENASAFVRGSENASAIVRRSENASAIVRRSENASAIVRRSENASAIVRRSENASAFVRRSENASAIVRGSENASAIVRRSENASAIVRRSENASAFVRRSENASAIVRRSENASAIVRCSENASAIVRCLCKIHACVFNQHITS
ncbi:uncharacterized protein LOC121385155 [Gigantopelta aegis]|uniref:uncharacterized protein LOC121385155 n=1 Tax=Gigantopelta aegis TaxID=1735272 RepID=UPI001B88942B|nr:uncharacterized protein LOC121385155 [Gigantopelta aegis]